MKEVVEVVFRCDQEDRSPAEDQRSEEPPKPAQSSPSREIVGGVDHAAEEFCTEPPGVPVARSCTRVGHLGTRLVLGTSASVPFASNNALQEWTLWRDTPKRRAAFDVLPISIA